MNQYFTIDGFESMTLQDIFNLSASHLLKQMKRCVEGSSATKCVYNGPDGMTCAAGVFIAPEFRKAADENKDAKELFGDSSWIGLVRTNKVPTNGQDLIHELQLIHDNVTEGPETWKERLQRLAVSYGLNPEVTP